jgi:hypothetical protein
MTRPVIDVVAQSALAHELNLTTRRVRQLVAEGVLPCADEEGRYDLQRCRERYLLFQSRRDASAWTSFEESLIQLAHKAERLVNRALQARSTEAQLRAASVATQELMTDLRFMTVCRSRSEAEQALFLEMWRDREDRALGLLVARATAACREVRGPGLPGREPAGGRFKPSSR